MRMQSCSLGGRGPLARVKRGAARRGARACSDDQIVKLTAAPRAVITTIITGRNNAYTGDTRHIPDNSNAWRVEQSGGRKRHGDAAGLLPRQKHPTCPRLGFHVFSRHLRFRVNAHVTSFHERAAVRRVRYEER